MPQAALGAHQQQMFSSGVKPRELSFNAASGTWRASTATATSRLPFNSKAVSMPQAALGAHQRQPSSRIKMVMFQCRKRHLARINSNAVGKGPAEARAFQCRKRHLARINQEAERPKVSIALGVSMPQAALGAHQPKLLQCKNTLQFQCRKRHLARINQFGMSIICRVKFQCRKRHLARINCTMSKAA